MSQELQDALNDPWVWLALGLLAAVLLLLVVAAGLCVEA